MSKQGPKDANELAFRIMQEAVGEAPPSRETIQGKNPAAVALGRLGGLKGGKARAANGFSKKMENHEAAIALHFMYYNFCRKHQTTKTTPAVAAGVCQEPWTIEDLVSLISN